MRALIMLVDDNAKLLSGLKLRLEMKGYQVLLAYDGDEALNLLKSTKPDLIVADVMMPRLNGWELFSRVRDDPRLASIPFIFLTARSDEISIQQGKALGAEDYITKPFKADELIASINGKLHRASQLARLSAIHTGESDLSIIESKNLCIDLSAHRVEKNGEEIGLTPTEFELLAYLAKNAGQVCSLDALASAVYPSNSNPWDFQDTLRVHIKNLRKKLGTEPSHPEYIVNVRGVGYRFEA